MDILRTMKTSDGMVVVLNHKIGNGKISKDAVIEAIDQYEQEYKSCPSCRKIGKIVDDFGWRVINGKTIPQSWCTPCRGGKPK